MNDYEMNIKDKEKIIKAPIGRTNGYYITQTIVDAR